MTRESHPRVQDLRHPRIGKPRRGLQILDTRMGFPRPSLNEVIDYFSHSCLKIGKICLKHTLVAAFLDFLALTLCDVRDE